MNCEIEGCDRQATWRTFCMKHGMQRYRAGLIRSGVKPRGSLEERFWAKVDCDEPDKCWLWNGNTQRSGYGRIQSGGKGTKTLLAHRYSYELHNRPIPDGLIVLHSCDTPGCVNPAHLRLGTYQENMDDMWAKGRARPGGATGEDNPRSKLTEAQVRYIKAHPERRHTAIAKEFGLSPNTIRGVRIGRTWNHIK